MTEVTKSCGQWMMRSNKIADKLRIMVVESKVSGSHPTAVLEKRGLALVAKYYQCPKVEPSSLSEREREQ
jgi:hypothetical protein